LKEKAKGRVIGRGMALGFSLVLMVLKTVGMLVLLACGFVASVKGL